jgi:hypothetical protein
MFAGMSNWAQTTGALYDFCALEIKDLINWDTGYPRIFWILTYKNGKCFDGINAESAFKFASVW